MKFRQMPIVTIKPMENQDSSRSVTIWLEHARDGDDLATQKLFERYFQQLVAVSSQRVPRKKRVEDGEDAAIDTMYDFLQGLSDGKFPDVKDRSSVWPLLVDIVVKKSLQQQRKQYAKKRQDNQIRGESVLAEIGNGELRLSDFAIDSGTHSVEATVRMFGETLSDLEREIFELKLSNKSNRKIAEILERPPRTIDRKVTGIMVKLADLFVSE